MAFPLAKQLVNSDVELLDSLHSRFPQRLNHLRQIKCTFQNGSKKSTRIWAAYLADVLACAKNSNCKAWEHEVCPLAELVNKGLHLATACYGWVVNNDERYGPCIHLLQTCVEMLFCIQLIDRIILSMKSAGNNLSYL